jgi:hypothetical protein
MLASMVHMLQCFYVEPTLWTMLPMLLLWPGLCYLYAALCLLLWPDLCGSSMVWPMRLPMLASIVIVNRIDVYRTQPHLGCCLAAAVAAASAIFMQLCTNSATPYTSRQHMRSCRAPCLLLLLLQIRTQPHLGCCLAAATAEASAIFMHLCTNSATPYTSRQHVRSCNDVNGNCANRRSRLTTAVAGHEKRRWASSSTGWSCIPKAAHRLQPRANQTTP